MIEPAASMNTMTQPEAMPGLACGITIRQWCATVPAAQVLAPPRSGCESSDWIEL